MLSRFSCVQLFATLWTVACQAPLPMGFSRQDYWSALPCPPPGQLPNPGIEPTSLRSPALVTGFFITKPSAAAAAAAAKSLQSCPTLSNPMDCSPPGSSVHGILQARVLEWGAIAFSDVLSRKQQKKIIFPNKTQH